MQPADLERLVWALDPASLMVDAGLTPDPWQAALLRSGATRTLVCCGRQVGKTQVVACKSIQIALCYLSMPIHRDLAPGGRPVELDESDPLYRPKASDQDPRVRTLTEAMRADPRYQRF